MLLITVDDLERADALSRALIAALIPHTASCPLALFTQRELREALARTMVDASANKRSVTSATTTANTSC